AQALAVPSLLPAPQQLPARLAQRVERADHGKVAHGAWTDGPTAEAAEEIVEGLVETAPVAFLDDGLAAFLAQVADIVEADAHGIGSRTAPPGAFGADLPGERGGEVALYSLGQAADARQVDVHRQRRQPMALQVLDQHARVIEPHRLVVQQA